ADGCRGDLSDGFRRTLGTASRKDGQRPGDGEQFFRSLIANHWAPRCETVWASRVARLGSARGESICSKTSPPRLATLLPIAPLPLRRETSLFPMTFVGP